MILNEAQRALINLPLTARVFLEGPAGAGKTTAAVQRLLHLLERRVRGETVLLLLPQRTLATPYEKALRGPEAAAGIYVQPVTLGGLARRMVDLFWPLVAERAGFAHPDAPPTFLNLEAAQYYMGYLLRPLLDEGLFDSVTIDRNRLYSQVQDNLTKAAVVGFPSTEIGERLKSAWVGEPGQLRVYDDVQTSANLFREFCLEHNLLDFSLQMQLFRDYLWPLQECRDNLASTYRHLVYDNAEEDNPFAHDLVGEWLPNFQSALVVYDWDAGFRRFLGADPHTAYNLKEACEQTITFPESLVSSPEVRSLSAHLSGSLAPQHIPDADEQIAAETDWRPALQLDFHAFFPEMLDWVAESIAHLVRDEGLSPGEIVVLAPFLSDSLRFTLADRLASHFIPVRSHRPSRSLREEPATQCLLTLAALTHPDWGIQPAKFDVAYALMQAILGMDLVRAQLLAEIIYRKQDGTPVLNSFENIRPEVQERITYRLGARYERLRNWLNAAMQRDDELDHFMSRLFGEVLSQPGFGFHASFDAGRVTANLIDSVQNFRRAVGGTLQELNVPLGREYLQTVQEGLIAAQYLQNWQPAPENAVFMAPAYTFLLSNRPVSVQFWLDVGSRAWGERLDQPLTQPYVLSRQWEPGRIWSDVDEVAAGQDALYRVVTGLLRRCRQRVYIGLSELGEQGYEQRGTLLDAFQHVLRSADATASPPEPTAP